MVDINSAISHQTTIARAYKEGCDKIFVTSSIELFGSLVQAAKVEGKMKITMVDPRRPLTIQTGGNACINIYRVLNNELSVTPISVQVGGHEGDSVVFASSKSLPASADGKIDLEKLKNEVELLENMRVFHKKDEFHIEGTKQERALEVITDADYAFWEGIKAESLFNSDRMFHCPVFDGMAETDYDSRKCYTEALRMLNNCIELDMTNYSFYSKRAAVLCKLKLYGRALADAENYCRMRPQSPSGYCLKGVCYYGLNEFSSAIKELEKGVDICPIAYYDNSRVWSTGTDIKHALAMAVHKMQKLSETAKVANKQGLTWLERGDYGNAVPKLLEAMKLTAQSLGKEHLSYSVAINNLAACQEAMGNYEEALKNYLNALQLVEIASFGEITFFLILGRHMPNTCASGVWSESGWTPGALTCNPYVKVELLERSTITFVQESKIIQNSHQPKWDQVIKMQAKSADCEINFSLLSRSSQNQAICNKLEECSNKKLLLKEQIEKMEQHIEDLRSKFDESAIAGKKNKIPAEVEEAKLAKFKLEREIEDAKEEIQVMQGELEKYDKVIEAMETEKQSTVDTQIGKCTYSIRKLANTLHGKRVVYDKQWFTVIDENGRKIRGEDFGVTALHIEISWMPEDVEYPSRLCNIGNLYRIIGDTYSSRAGGGNDLRKMENYHILAEQYLDSALIAMKHCKSKVQIEETDILKVASSDPNKIKYVDGSRTPEYLTVLENLAVLHKSKGMVQIFPKGTSESAIIKMQANWSRSRIRALELLQEAIELRAALGHASSPEHILLLLHKVSIYWSMEDFQGAFPIQEQITRLVKDGRSNQVDWTRQLGALNELHILLGDTNVEVHDDGGWSIDSSQSWHWEMVAILSKRVKSMSKVQSAAAAGLQRELDEVSSQMKQHKINIHDPPPVTDYRKLTNIDDSLSLRVLAAAEATARGEDSAGVEVKVARAMASKMKKPETQLVSTDTQMWPNKMLHTRGS